MASDNSKELRLITIVFGFVVVVGLLLFRINEDSASTDSSSLSLSDSSFVSEAQADNRPFDSMQAMLMPVVPQPDEMSDVYAAGGSCECQIFIYSYEGCGPCEVMKNWVKEQKEKYGLCVQIRVIPCDKGTPSEGHCKRELGEPLVIPWMKLHCSSKDKIDMNPLPDGNRGIEDIFKRMSEDCKCPKSFCEGNSCDPKGTGGACENGAECKEDTHCTEDSAGVFRCQPGRAPPGFKATKCRDAYDCVPTATPTPEPTSSPQNSPSVDPTPWPSGY